MSPILRTVAAVLASLLLVTACGGGGSGEPAGRAATAPVTVDDEGNTAFDTTALNASLAALPIGVLTADERDGLLLMREEEKLARDVYLALPSSTDSAVSD